MAGNPHSGKRCSSRIMSSVLAHCPWLSIMKRTIPQVKTEPARSTGPSPAWRICRSTLSVWRLAQAKSLSLSRGGGSRGISKPQIPRDYLALLLLRTPAPTVTIPRFEHVLCCRLVPPAMLKTFDPSMKRSRRAASFAPPAARVAAGARVARNQCPPHQCCMAADALRSRLSGANAP